MRLDGFGQEINLIPDDVSESLCTSLLRRPKPGLARGGR